MIMNENPINLISLDQAATVIGCQARTLRKAAQEGRLEAVKIANSWLITPEALQQWRAEYWMIGNSRPRNRKKVNMTP